MNAEDQQCTNLEHSDTTDKIPSFGLCMTDFGMLPPETLLDAVALSAHLRVSTRTLSRMVSRGELPEGIKQGRRRVWVVGALLEFFAEEAGRKSEEAKKTQHRLRIVGA